MQILQKNEEKEDEVAEGDVKVNIDVPMTVEELDNESGYYQYAIRPLLLPGHEGELCEWLKEMGLMQRSMRCINPTCCDRGIVLMQWCPARIIDKYQWQCSECNMRRSIRDDSFFKQIKCSLDLVLRIILGWCKDIDADILSKCVPNAKSHVIKKVYELCSMIAEKYVESHKQNWQLGGPEHVVIVGLLPYEQSKNNDNIVLRNNNVTSILSFVEVKEIPPKHWFHLLSERKELISETEANNIKIAEILEVIQEMIRPGTSILVDTYTANFLTDILNQFRDYYPIIKTTQELSVYDENTRSYHLIDNLETIWKPAMLICEIAQDYPKTEINHFVRNQLWRQKFAPNASMAMETILHHIADCWLKSH